MRESRGRGQNLLWKKPDVRESRDRDQNMLWKKLDEKENWPITNIQNLVRKKGKQSRQSRIQFQQKMTDEDFAVKNFASLCAEMPVFTCLVCKTVRFRSQVLSQLKSYEKKNMKAFTLASQFANSPQEKCYICHACHDKILHGLNPPTAHNNKLHSEDMPAGMDDLNTPEEQLISPVIPFMKILPLHKTKQHGIHGPVVLCTCKYWEYCYQSPKTTP